MGNPAFSAGVSLLLTIVIVAVGQVFKEQLAASRQGTLLAGTLGSLTFVFALTSLSNLKMIDSGGHASSAAKSGLFDVGVALTVAVIASASIHRVAISLCVIFSCVILFFLCAISNHRYGGVGGSATAHSAGAPKNAAGKRTK